MTGTRKKGGVKAPAEQFNRIHPDDGFLADFKARYPMPELKYFFPADLQKIITAAKAPPLPDSWHFAHIVRIVDGMLNNKQIPKPPPNEAYNRFFEAIDTIVEVLPGLIKNGKNYIEQLKKDPLAERSSEVTHYTERTERLEHLWEVAENVSNIRHPKKKGRGRPRPLFSTRQARSIAQHLAAGWELSGLTERLDNATYRVIQHILERVDGRKPHIDTIRSALENDPPPVVTKFAKDDSAN